MPFEQYKTQVLLLHSQQTTLDRLRTGFNDRYSVHCATSGTEALNTLGDTPIHVIVSAQDLPGMSGLDALREAKKRSPETIAILLAGTDAGDGLEALVSDKEVFQIVRGEISPEALKDLIDNATKSVRLLALSEASNDTAANVDEPYPTGEHIVMETAANGSVIISDGTGTVPVLRPEKIQVSVNSGGQSVDVLVLTKDEEFLGTIKESSRGMHNVHHAVTPGQAEEIAHNHPVGVLVTDAAMVGSNIEALSQRLRADAPRLVAIVAGRRDDGELLMDLINRGHVYRFLLKPVSPGRARLAIEASVKHHMEAPESAFKGKPRAAGAPKPQMPPPAANAAAKPVAPPPARPAAAPTSKPPPKPVPQPAAKAPARPSPKPAPQPATRAAAPARAAPPQKTEPRISATPPPAAAATDGRRAPVFASTAADDSLLSDSLDDAFEETNSFTETMTGIAISVGKSISGAAESLKRKNKSEPAPAPAPAPQAPSAVPAPAPQVPSTGPAAALAPRPASSDGGGLMSNPKVIALIAGVLLFGVLSLWMFSGDDAPIADTPVAAENPAIDEEPAATPIEPQDSAPLSAPAPQPAAFENLLQRARDARTRGDVFSPARQNAVELLLAARDAAPDNADIAAELETTIDEVFGLAENALLADRSTDASRALRVISLADPDNPRLAFLNAQLSQQQLRAFLDDARAAIRDDRFEDAGRLLAQAEQTAGGGNAEIDALSEELANARSSQRIDDVLSLAGQRLSEDRLISPANDNARYYFQLAQNSDPANAAAQQGLVAVASKLVLRAREAADTGDFDAAEALLEDARELDANSSELNAAEEALDNARNQQTAQDLVAAEQQREAARLAAEREDMARREAEANQRAAERAAAERAAAERAAAEQEAARLAAEQTRQAEAAAAASAEDSRPAVAAATAAEGAGSERPIETVAISALERTRYIPPRYPRSAQRRNVSGVVDLAFTVTATGAVSDVEVTHSEPGTLFDAAAIEAVEQWEFEPPMDNGTPVQKRVAVRMSFALQ